MVFFDFGNPGFRAVFIAIIGLLAIWELVWKGFALWKSARNNHVAWFVCILFFNTVGILPIVYLLLNRNKEIKL